jgi:hypothetical protein
MAQEARNIPPAGQVLWLVETGFFVMAGLVPASTFFLLGCGKDGCRHKAGHDELRKITRSLHSSSLWKMGSYSPGRFLS